MATYLILNLVFIAIAILVLSLTKSLNLNQATLVTMAIILLMTAVFDSLIIGVGIVAYDENLITGIKIGLAPIEDFFYAVLAVLLVPAVWTMLKKEQHGKN